jgi:hypothetical protein
VHEKVADKSIEVSSVATEKQVSNNWRLSRGFLFTSPVVFKLCAAALWGAVRNLKGAANFFRQDEILQFFYRNLLGCAAKNFWSLSECREPKSLKTTALALRIFLTVHRV